MKPQDKEVAAVLQDVLESWKVQVDGDQIRCQCPLCDDSSQHLYISVTKWLYHCFKCKAGGSILEWVIENPHMPVRVKVKKELGTSVRFKGSFYPIKKEQETHVEVQNLRLNMDRVGWSDTAISEKAKTYCGMRGMTKDQIRSYCVSTIRFETNIYFPVWDFDLAIYFYVSKDLYALSGEGGYSFPKDVKKPLFGPHIKQGKVDAGRVVLVEGVFDQIVTPESCAVLGSELTENQLFLLIENEIGEVLIIFDGDEAGRKGSNKASLLLRGSGIIATEIYLPWEMDLSKLGRETMNELVDVGWAGCARTLRNKTLIYKP